MSDADFGDRPWGLVTLSVASAREKPDHKAELGTQIPLGQAVRLLRAEGLWLFVEAPSGYRAWIESGTIVRATAAQVESWNGGPLVIVTATEAVVYSKPDRASDPVGDVVIGNLLTGGTSGPRWREVSFPDGRSGFVEADAVTDHASWRRQPPPTAARIEATARRFLGRPYLWGGNTPKGLDCSGLTQLVFGLNGISLPHQASQQATRGMAVPLDPEARSFRAGDLLFFGRAAGPESGEKVVHVGIYLGDGRVLHASERVHLAPLDELVSRRGGNGKFTLLHARRLLPAAAP
ncbi:MAG: C40 family peptidase [Verrucomicrobia bacterium]|nr:C40 family peptidase [Verrucomicrobiota bacterium]